MEAKRISNFSPVEIDTLITLVKKYKDVEECKRSDTVRSKEKLKAWDDISKEFNLILNLKIQRTAKNLRDKYENIKKTSKKKFAMEKREMYKTGGGTSAPVLISKTDLDIRELLGIAATGMTNAFDYDSYNNQEVANDIMMDHDYLQCGENFVEKTLSNEMVQEETAAELHWSSWNPSDLRTRISSPLRVVDAAEEPRGSGCLRETTGNNQSPGTKAANKRSRSHITQECRTKISLMSQAKIDLAHIQIDAIKQEMEIKKKEFDLKKCHWEEEHNLKMKQEKEEHDLKMEKLNVELQLLKKDLEI